jgi:hypothetical protein
MVAGILPFGLSEEFGRLLLVLAELDRVRLVRQAGLLQHDRDLHAVQRERIKLEAIRVRGRPAGDGKEEREGIGGL